MARAPAVHEIEELPEADRLEGFPHPRATARLYGQEIAERTLADAFASGRMHHGWLLSGPEGIGKATLAYRFARFVLADAASRDMFGQSLDAPDDGASARQVRALSHPGLLVIRRAYDTKTKRFPATIPVDDVRRLKTFLGRTSETGAWRVVIVDRADELNISAANALLKSLEEPPPRTIFLLVSSAPGRLLTTIRSRVGKHADVQIASLAIGGLLVKQTIEGLVEGEGTNSLIRGIALGDAHQHFDFVTLQDHVGAKSTSDVEIKAALAGASRSIYYGVTRVEPTAAGAAANQRNRNLLLSEHAKADSDPVLEILTSDVVRCGHGATVGPVDQEALFYLQSRGLDFRSALKLLVGGFFESVLSDPAYVALSGELHERVERKLAVAEL